MSLFGRFEIRQLQKAIKRNPDDRDAILELGWLYLDGEQYSEAQEQFVRILDMTGTTTYRVQARFGLAMIDLKHGKTGAAKEAIESILQECIDSSIDFPRSAEAHFYLGTLFEKQLRESKNPSDLEIQHLLQKATREYEAAIAKQSQEAHKAKYLLGKLYLDYREGEKALIYLETALKDDKLDKGLRAEIYNALGTLYKTLKDDLETAKAYHRRVLEQTSHPTLLASSYRQLGDIYREQTLYPLALDSYQRALKYYGDSRSKEVLEAYLSLAEMYLKEGHFRKATESGEYVLSFGAEFKDLLGRTYALLAKSYQGLEAYEKALEFQKLHVEWVSSPVEKSITSPTKKVDSLIQLAQLYEKLGRYPDVIETYKSTLKLHPDTQTAADIHLALGRVYASEEKYSPAIKQLEDSLKLQTIEEKKAEAYRLLGNCLIKRRDIEKGIEMLSTVIANYQQYEVALEVKRELKDLKKEIIQEVKTEKLNEAEAERLKSIIDEILEEKGFFERLKQGLARTHQNFIKNLETLLTGRTRIDEAFLEELEEVLILADLGVDTTLKIISSIQNKVKRKELEDPAQLKFHLKREILAILKNGETVIDINRATPFVIMVIGVNGTGKTTTIGKLAHGFKQAGKEVLLVAGDTFRAAAIEQLEIWGERAGCEVIKHTAGADPSAVIYDAIQAAKSRKTDVVIVDTAGRLHTKKNLMEELKKMKRVTERELPGAPHEILLVVDATTGQNAISQVKLFNENMGLTGLILTKLDGTAKGGIITGIVNELKIPVAYIGVGEKLEDLRPFKAEEFVEALFEE